MLKKLGIGGAFAFAAAAIAIGCSSSGSNGFFGTSNGGPELFDDGNFPAGSIAQNNLAPDQGGFSHNNQDFLGVVCKQNTSDNTVVLMFETVEAQTGTVVFPASYTNPGLHRYWLSYFDGRQLTPPVEVSGVDRDENDSPAGAGGIAAALGGGWTNINATVMIPLNTQGYVDSAGAQNQNVSGNAGNWLILWDAETFNQAPALLIPDAVTNSVAGTQAANAQGAHHTFYASMFLKQLANQPTATSNLVGNTAAAGTTANGPTLEFRFGFQVLGTEVPSSRGGASATSTDSFPFATGGLGLIGTTVVNPAASGGKGGFDFRPAEDVISFGVASDTIKGQANFGAGGIGNSNSGPTGLTPGKPLGTVGGGAFIPGLTQWTSGGGPTIPGKVKRGGGAGPGAAGYNVGDTTSFVQIFWVQLVSSAAGQSQTLAAFAKDGDIQLGPQYKLFTANFNLASMSVPTSGAGSPAVVPFPATTLRGTVAGTSPGAVQPIPEFVTYNNLIFWNYIDASMATGNALGLAGSGIDEAVVEQVSRVQAISAVVQGPAGTASLSTTAQEVTRAGTAFRHATSVLDSRDARLFAATRGAYYLSGISIGFNTVSGGKFNSLVNHVSGDEFVFQPDNGCQIFGPDEGTCDVTALFQGRVTTNGGSATVDEDLQLWAFAVNKDNTVITGETQPQVLSSHKPEPDPDHTLQAWDPGHFVLTSPGPDTILHDDVFDVKTVTNRDGSYAVIGYRQAQGTSIQQHTSLLANCLKLFRCVACNSAGTGTGGVTPTLANRFLVSPLGSGTAPAAGDGRVINGTISLTAGNYAAIASGGNGATMSVIDASTLRNASLCAASPAVQAYQFQNDMGQGCGFQSDRTKLCVLWAHGDGSDDRVFVKTITVGGIAATNATTDNPTLTFAGEAEVEATASVLGVATVVNPPTILRNTYHFSPGTVVATAGNVPSDAGPGFGVPGAQTIKGYRLEASEGARTNGVFTVYPFPGFPPHTSAGSWPKDAAALGGTSLGYAYTFNSNPGNGIAGFQMSDAGPDSAGTGGAVVIFFNKVTDATTTDGNGYSQAVFADLYNNASITDRVVMSRRLRLSGGVDQGENLTPGFGGGGPGSFTIPAFGTALDKAVLVPKSSDPCKAVFSASAMYVYLNAPIGDSGSSPIGCFTRKLDLSKRANPGSTAPTFASLFSPATDTATTPTTNNFLDPQRLDRELSSNAAFADIFTAGSQVIVLITQDNHLWGTVTNDGVTYTNDGGRPKPSLVDNNLSTTGVAIGSVSCHLGDSNCDDTHGSLLGFKKYDSDKQIRYFLRIVQ